MFKVGFILNSRISRKKKFYQELDHAKRTLRNVEFTVAETLQAGHAKILTGVFIKQGFTHLIAVGGDGTLNEVINGFMDQYQEEIVVGLLPYGSANDFAKTIRSPSNMVDLFEAVSKERSSKIDVGLVQFQDSKRYFINIADVGIGASIVQRVNKSKKLLGAGFTFFGAILRTFLSYKNQNINCKTHDWEYEGKVNSLVMANGKYFGHGLCIAPDANLADGQLAILISGDITIWDYIKNVKTVKKGIRVNHPLLQYKTANKLELTSEVPCGIEADGEFIGTTPATISVAAKKIRFLV
ncbi:MAG TPA: diacylglycerol kinase family lipid kinase [Fulvivirga sp.]|nr:diacylglycerol kinase family lipid kinase [Fulvivirga sp.]